MIWDDCTNAVMLLGLFTMANFPNTTLCIAAAIMGYPNAEALKWGMIGILGRIDDGLGILVDPIVSYALAPMAKILVDWRIHPAYLYTDLLEVLAIPVAALCEFMATMAAGCAAILNSAFVAPLCDIGQAVGVLGPGGWCGYV